MDLSTIPVINLIILSGTVLAIVGLIVLLVWFRGAKLSLGEKTVEIQGPDGEVQQGDANSLMYVMNDACHQIEQRKKERIDNIIPDLSERFETISDLSCLELKVESLLHEFRRRNGFDKLVADKEVNEYIERIAERLERGVRKEAAKVVSCSAVSPDINASAIKPLAKAFAVQAVRECVQEYDEKRKMYEQYLPLFSALGDKIRIGFCKNKIEKHGERVKSLNSMLERILV